MVPARAQGIFLPAPGGPPCPGAAHLLLVQLPARSQLYARHVEIHQMGHCPPAWACSTPSCDQHYTYYTCWATRRLHTLRSWVSVRVLCLCIQTGSRGLFATCVATSATPLCHSQPHQTEGQAI